MKHGNANPPEERGSCKIALATLGFKPAQMKVVITLSSWVISEDIQKFGQKCHFKEVDPPDWCKGERLPGQTMPCELLEDRVHVYMLGNRRDPPVFQCLGNKIWQTTVEVYGAAGGGVSGTTGIVWIWSN